MYKRIIQLSSEDSFFLFGARGTGKSTLLEHTQFLNKALIFDLLNQDLEQEFSLRPQLLYERCAHLSKGDWVVIDEVQKIPELLDVVHSLIEKKKIKFALTGSSSRKLKRKSANLLAGRAFISTLHPLLLHELGKDFDLNFTLSWGSLPKVHAYASDSLRAKFLRSYIQTYVKEEIVAEQLVRNLNPFRMFLPIAAQMNTKPLNYTNIARDTGVDYKTIQSYFDILTETYMGTYLESYSGSARKVQIQAPKFYFFDMGVKRALSNQLNIPLESETNLYGEAFETWFINQCFALNSYFELDLKFSYLRTKDDAEIDLIIEYPNGKKALVEVKSASYMDERHIKHLKSFIPNFPNSKYICVSNIQSRQKIGEIEILPYQLAFKALDLIP